MADRVAPESWFNLGTSFRHIFKPSIPVKGEVMPVAIECAVCGKVFYEAPSRADRRKYCSYECTFKGKDTKVEKHCEECGVVFRAMLCRGDKARFCSPDCFYLNTKKTEIERNFWPKVKKTDGCWEWNGTPKGNGYCRCRYGGKEELAHRVSYMVHHGDIPEGLFVCHTCDNRKCVNPDHLFVGTAKDNLDDMRRKGRGRGGTRYPKKIARQIRELRDQGLSCRFVGQELGVSEKYVSEVYRGKIKRDVY